VEFIRLAKSRGLGPVQLATNGSLLSAELAQGLLAVGLDFISFSLDTVDPAEYSLIRVGGDLAKVMQNLERFMEMRDKGGFPTEIQVSATRTDLNAASIERFKDYWTPRADRTRIYYEHSKDGHTGSLDCPETAEPMERQACPKVFQDMVILYDGAVAACNHDWFREQPLGNVSEEDIARVWHSAAYRALRQEHLHPEGMVNQTCLHCDHWKIGYLPQKMIGELYTREAREHVAC
jgi:radical SAM protein with 4Fe4S-binding SPASM domain